MHEKSRIAWFRLGMWKSRVRGKEQKDDHALSVKKYRMSYMY